MRITKYRHPVPTFIGSDGASLYYEDPHPAAAGPPGRRAAGPPGRRAAGPPVVAVAGGAARHPSYLGDLAGLAGKQRLILPHLRGVGRSPLPASVEGASFWRQAEDIERLRIHLGLERVLLLGHSAGTRLVLSYAAQFPQRLAGMVLVTPPAGYLVDEASDVEELIERRRGEPAFDAAVAAWGAGPDTTDDAGFNDWYLRTAPMSYAAWGEREQTHATVGAYNFAANRAYFSVDPPPDLAARLGAVTAPVLVVAGAEDCSTGVAPVVALAKLFPSGEAVVIERCGHFPWVEQPAEFRRAVDSFLSALSR
jgi:pimeloyl-ACP methyl ester carboxylesterase